MDEGFHLAPVSGPGSVRAASRPRRLSPSRTRGSLYGPLLLISSQHLGVQPSARVVSLRGASLTALPFIRF